MLFDNKVVQWHRWLRLHMAPEPGALTRTSREENPPVKPQLNWTTAKWAVLGAWLPLILAKSIAVVPSGMGGIRVSQTSETRPGILYPGVQRVTPLPQLRFPPEIQTGPASAGAGPFRRK